MFCHAYCDFFFLPYNFEEGVDRSSYLSNCENDCNLILIIGNIIKHYFILLWINNPNGFCVLFILNN